MRAFLQRCDVRLSTMHRVATALLSGAGILVLLPALERDAVVQVLSTLLAGPVTWSRGAIAVGVVLSIGLALAAFWLLVLELTRFYFHSNHIRHEMGAAGGGDVYTPRFTLTALRLPSGDLSTSTEGEYVASHASPDNVQLLVASNEQARSRIDRRLRAYPGVVVGGDGTTAAADAARAAALFDLGASHRRTLVEEVTKVEYGMVRHVIRLQVIVLRYVKALLVILVTALASFASAASVSIGSVATAAEQRWLAGVLVVWAPAVMIVAAAPVRWLERLLRNEGARGTGLARDADLTLVEDVANRVASVVWVLSVVTLVGLLVDHPVTAAGRTLAIVAIVGSIIAIGWHIVERRRQTRIDVPNAFEGALP